MSGTLQTIETDVLVVGGGLAALRAALAARAAGARVMLAVKRKAGRSGSSANTSGGYAAAWDFLDPLDDAQKHYEDTISGGGAVNDRAMVRALVEEAPRRLQELFDIGAEFRKREGRYHLSPSGDHRRPRVIVPQNMRGTDMTLPLAKAVEEAGVDTLENCVVVDLLRSDDRVVGALAVARDRAEGWVIRAGATVLAAGGAGRLFPVTSNPVDVRGGGYALALRAGARLRDMEFIQFYPWRLIRPFKGTRMPIQPSTFVAGGRLFNSRGERFMERYDPVKKEATTRDVSARGIFDQIRQGLDVEGGVILDVSEIPDEQFRIDNTKVTEALDPKGVDYRRIPLILAPEAHFFMGGVLTDDQGASDLRGLYAAGENAGGVHGGNRLNSNAVPETQVFGVRAGVAAAVSAQTYGPGTLPDAPVAAFRARLATLQTATVQASQPFDDLATRVQQAANLGIGIVRTDAGLRVALDAFARMHDELQRLPVASVGDMVAAGEIADMLATGTACAASAQFRTESRAAHYREDYPALDPAWVCTVTYADGRCERAPVTPGADETTPGQFAQEPVPMAPARSDTWEFVE